jgi:hypothetical protein
MNTTNAAITSRPCRFCGRLIGGRGSSALTRHERSAHRAAFDAAIEAAVNAAMEARK